MTAKELFEKIIRQLEQVGIRYLCSGSYASTHYGESRFTNDIDIVIELQEADVPTFVEAFSSEFEIDEVMIQDAVRHHTEFTLWHREWGPKIDFWLMNPFDEHDEARFARRVQATILGCRVWLPTAEDVIIAKLRWLKISHSEKQIADIRGILRIQRDGLDLEYVREWIQTLGLHQQWETCVNEL
jgi:predicted nucleotidyltransferase